MFVHVHSEVALHPGCVQVQAEVPVLEAELCVEAGGGSVHGAELRGKNMQILPVLYETDFHGKANLRCVSFSEIVRLCGELRGTACGERGRHHRLEGPIPRPLRR